MHADDEVNRTCPETSLPSLTLPFLPGTEQVAALIHGLAFAISSAAHRPYHVCFG